MPRGAAFVRSGKVRDLYAVGTDRLLLVASDRLSAFDVVLPTTIPDKGRVLTGLSRYWFGETRDIVPNHLLSTDPADVPEGIVGADDHERLRGRMMLGRRAEVLPIEVVIRGFLAGSGWKAYRADGAICGIVLPDGLEESGRLPAPILTPATKAESGAHDENIDFATMVEALEPIAPRAGVSARALAGRVREVALALYARATERCRSVGLILADTKFEFGFEFDVGGNPTDQLLLIDEVLTPDSSRYWDAAGWQPGREQPSFDKQFLREYLNGLVSRGEWNKQAPGPRLPPEVVEGTRRRYEEARRRLFG